MVYKFYWTPKCNKHKRVYCKKCGIEENSSTHTTVNGKGRIGKLIDDSKKKD